MEKLSYICGCNQKNNKQLKIGEKKMAQCMYVERKHVIEYTPNATIETCDALTDLLNMVGVDYLLRDYYDEGEVQRQNLKEGIETFRKHLDGEECIDMEELSAFKERCEIEDDRDILKFLEWMYEKSDQTNDTIYFSFF